MGLQVRGDERDSVKKLAVVLGLRIPEEQQVFQAKCGGRFKTQKGLTQHTPRALG